MSGTLRAAPNSRASHRKHSAMDEPELLVPFDLAQITSADNRSNPQPGDPSPSLATQGKPPAIAFAMRGRDEGNMCEVTGDVVSALRAESGGSTRDMIAVDLFNQAITGNVGMTLGSGDPPHGQPAVITGRRRRYAVRRLMPIECERLQGFPDLHTLIPYRGKPATDGPRYAALGNSWAVNCAEWIGERMDWVEENSHLFGGPWPPLEDGPEYRGTRQEALASGPSVDPMKGPSRQRKGNPARR